MNQVTTRENVKPFKTFWTHNLQDILEKIKQPPPKKQAIKKRLLINKLHKVTKHKLVVNLSSYALTDSLQLPSSKILSLCWKGGTKFSTISQ